MVEIEQIPVERIDEFWALHIDYLVNDGIISDEEDVAYFHGDEYRSIIRAHMERTVDRHHLVYFVEDGRRIGAAQYCTYHSEDGKCLIGDFWVFAPYRGNGMGHRCYQALEAYAKQDGALYFELNCERENAERFWRSNGYVENGVDEYDMKLFIKK